MRTPKHVSVYCTKLREKKTTKSFMAVYGACIENHRITCIWQHDELLIATDDDD